MPHQTVKKQTSVWGIFVGASGEFQTGDDSPEGRCGNRPTGGAFPSLTPPPLALTKNLLGELLVHEPRQPKRWTQTVSVVIRPNPLYETFVFNFVAPSGGAAGTGNLRIATACVPEPGLVSLAGMGLGVLGLAVSRRRKQPSRRRGWVVAGPEAIAAGPAFFRGRIAACGTGSAAGPGWAWREHRHRRPCLSETTTGRSAIGGPAMNCRILCALLLSVLASFATASYAAEPKPLKPTPTFQWGDWFAEMGPDGNIQHLSVSYDEGEELTKLTEIARRYEETRRREHGVEPNLWKIVYCLSKETDMIFVDKDGTRYRETAGMGRSDLEWCLLNEQQYYDAAYAYSRGSIKIEATDRVMEEPLLGEYANNTFFWPRDWNDLGIGIDYHDYDSVIGHYFPGPTRPWARGGTGGGGNWCGALGHTSVQFAPGREVGGPLGDIGKITLHEWLHQIDGQKGWKCGYVGLPGQYAPGNYHHGSHLFWMWNVLTPRMWRTMRMQDPLMSPPNKPADRYEGFIRDWLVLGEFDLPGNMATSQAAIPHHLALEQDAFAVASAMPYEGSNAGGKEWKRQTSPWDRNSLAMRDAFGSPHRDAYAYAHVYVYSPNERTVLLWMGSFEPFAVYLNGVRVLKCWRGTAEDEAVRPVTLAKGWNRLLVKQLDQEARDWNLFCRFTDPGHQPMDDLQYSAAKPEADIVSSGKAAPPIEIKHYKWEWPYNDDWFGALPILHEEHLEAVTGLKGIRILGAPDRFMDRDLPWEERRWLMIDVSNVDKPGNVLSAVVPSTARKITLEQDSALNNVLNMSRETGDGRGYESMMMLRYAKPGGGHGDLVFVRADIIEMFMDIGKRANPSVNHAERILGFICRDSKTFLVFDTDLGEQLPINEMDAIVAKDDVLMLTAAPSRARVLRGEPCSVTFRVVNHSKQQVSGARIDVSLFDSDAAPVSKDLGALAPGVEAELTVPVSTPRERDLLVYVGSVTYNTPDGDGPIELRKLVPINLSDPLGIEIRVDGSELLQARRQRVRMEVRNNLAEAVAATLRPTFPNGYTVSPSSVNLTLDGLDDSKEFWFDVEIGDAAREGWETLTAEATTRNRPGLVSIGALPVYKSFGDDLVFEDFENGCGGDFAFTNAHYQVRLSRQGPKFGKQCLEIFDRGGARYGQVTCFGRSILPKSPQPKDTQYTYDTKVYPYVVFWFKTSHKNDNLGLHIVLDDGENGYGVLINGFWEQQWVPRMMVGQADGFEADGEWHRIVLNIDEALDGVLGKTSHFVREMDFGDTRTFASGWWYYYDAHHHYMDNFAIRKKAPGLPVPSSHMMVSAAGLPMLSQTNRVPAFDSETDNGIKATLRMDQLGYFPWDQQTMELWATNRSNNTVLVPTWPRNRIWEIEIRDMSGKPITDGWVSAYWRDEPRDQDRPRESGHFRELKPGESYSERMPVGDLCQDWLRNHGMELEAGKSYKLRVRYAPVYAEVQKGLEPWRGAAVSNDVTLKLIGVPTPEEELAALRTSVDPVRRAKAAAQLGKAQYEPALPALAENLLGDGDDDVRLNCAWAIGNYGRVDRNNDEQVGRMRPVVEALAKAMDDKNWRVGEYACTALGRLGDPWATEYMTPRLQNDSKWVRRKTAQALEEMADYDAVGPLAECMDDPSREVREAALGALVTLCNMSADRVRETGNRLRSIPEDDQNRQEERATVARAHDEARKQFQHVYGAAAQAASDEFYILRRIWIEALQRYREAADVKPVIKKALDDENEMVREAAIRSLRDYRADAADCASRIQELLADPYDAVRRAAVETLPGIAGKSIEELTGHDNVYWLRKFPRPVKWPMG
jgi:HEAT repeat protein